MGLPHAPPPRRRARPRRGYRDARSARADAPSARTDRFCTHPMDANDPCLVASLAVRGAAVPDTDPRRSCPCHRSCPSRRRPGATRRLDVAAHDATAEIGLRRPRPARSVRQRHAVARQRSLSITGLCSAHPHRHRCSCAATGRRAVTAARRSLAGPAARRGLRDRSTWSAARRHRLRSRRSPPLAALSGDGSFGNLHLCQPRAGADVPSVQTVARCASWRDKLKPGAAATLDGVGSRRRAEDRRAPSSTPTLAAAATRRTRTAGRASTSRRTTPACAFSGRIFSYGDGQGTPGHFNWHLAAFSERRLAAAMREAGLREVTRMERREVRGRPRLDQPRREGTALAARPAGGSVPGAARGAHAARRAVSLPKERRGGRRRPRPRRRSSGMLSPPACAGTPGSRSRPCRCWPARRPWPPPACGRCATRWAVLMPL